MWRMLGRGIQDLHKGVDAIYIVDGVTSAVAYMA